MHSAQLSIVNCLANMTGRVSDSSPVIVIIIIKVIYIVQVWKSIICAKSTVNL